MQLRHHNMAPLDDQSSHISIGTSPAYPPTSPQMRGSSPSDIKPSHELSPQKRLYQGDSDESSNKKSRGGYRCSKCGEPKKGHVCAYQPKPRRREEGDIKVHSAAVQVEMDPDNTCRTLDLSLQGYPESYAAAQLVVAQHQAMRYPPPQPPPIRRHWEMPDEEQQQHSRGHHSVPTRAGEHSQAYYAQEPYMRHHQDYMGSAGDLLAM